MQKAADYANHPCSVHGSQVPLSFLVLSIWSRGVGTVEAWDSTAFLGVETSRQPRNALLFAARK